MGRVQVAIGGRTYALSCGDGEEEHLAALGHHLAAKADELTAAIGTMSEPRLLLMAGLQVTDDLFAARAAPGDGAAAPDYAAVLARIEALAAALEAGADAHPPSPDAQRGRNDGPTMSPTSVDVSRSSNGIAPRHQGSGRPSPDDNVA